MKVDSPSYSKFCLPHIPQIFVYAYLFSTRKLVVANEARFTVKNVIDKAFYFKRVRQFDEYNCSPERKDIIAIFCCNSEVISLFCCSCCIFFWGKVKVFDDEIVLGNIFYILISEDDISLLIYLKLNAEKLLVFGLYFLFCEVSVPQFRYFYLKGEDYHTIFPSLQGNSFWYTVIG